MSVSEEDYASFKDLDVLGNDTGYLPLALMHGHWLPIMIVPSWLKTHNFPFRSDDVIVATSPSSGTHWVYYITYLLKTKNFGPIPVHMQRPLMEYPYSDESFQTLVDQKEPRLFSSHLPACVLPKHAFKAKVIYVYRNPKDVATSLYHHYLNQNGWVYEKSFEEFLEMFLDGKTIWGPQWKHVLSYHQLKEQGKPILFVKYEHLKQDTKGMIRKIGEFLEVDVDDDLINRIVDQTSIEKMRQNKDVDGSIWRSNGWKEGKNFIRKGQVGSWKDDFKNPEIREKFEKFYKDHLPAEYLE